MDDVFVYLRPDMPDGVTEMVTPCADGYTVYISAKLDKEHQFRAYEHALKHIKAGDFDVDQTATVQEIESRAHEDTPVPGDQFKADALEEIRKRKRSNRAKLARRTARNKWLADNGVDMFAVAESQWLDPDRR